MTERQKHLLAIAAGIILIVVYSVVMIASEGTSPWAWLLLFTGIALLVAGRRLGRTPPS